MIWVLTFGLIAMSAKKSHVIPIIFEFMDANQRKCHWGSNWIRFSTSLIASGVIRKRYLVRTAFLFMFLNIVGCNDDQAIRKECTESSGKSCLKFEGRVLDEGNQLFFNDKLVELDSEGRFEFYVKVKNGTSYEVRFRTDNNGRFNVDGPCFLTMNVTSWVHTCEV